jgi:MFS transporter, PPP family, 3-phenylpropionic acid transporter
MDEVRLPKQTLSRSTHPLDHELHPGRQTARDLIPFVILYVSLYAAFGALSPFLPAFLNSRQLRSDEIGFVLGTATAVRLIAGPVAGAAADRLQRARTVFAVCSIGAAIFALSNVALTTFWPLFVATVLWSASIAPAAPLTDAVALAAAKPRHGDKGFEYGWVRGAGSAAFVLGTIGAGQLVGPLGLGVTLALQACLLVFAATWIVWVPNYLAMPCGSRNPTEQGMLFELLRLRAFRQVVLVAALVLGSHAFHDSFAVIYWNSAGISPAVVSILWSEQVVAEVVVFLLIGPALLGWIGPAWALTASAAIGAIRWALSATSTDPYVLACIEPLHGATFALLHLASMRVIAVSTPPRLAATAQTVYGTLGIGAAVTLLTFASGVLYEHLGGRAFWVMSGFCLAAIPITRRLQVPE